MGVKGEMHRGRDKMRVRERYRVWIPMHRKRGKAHSTGESTAQCSTTQQNTTQLALKRDLDGPDRYGVDLYKYTVNWKQDKDSVSSYQTHGPDIRGPVQRPRSIECVQSIKREKNSC